jgi:hypothetical protein
MADFLSLSSSEQDQARTLADKIQERQSHACERGMPCWTDRVIRFAGSIQNYIWMSDAEKEIINKKIEFEYPVCGRFDSWTDRLLYATELVKRNDYRWYGREEQPWN